MDLKTIRQVIDRIDNGILELLYNRMEMALLARRFKSHIDDRQREKELFERIEKGAMELLDAEFLESIWSSIIRRSKDLQHKDYQLIAFQGEHGDYDEIASRKWNKSLIPIPCHDFAKVFKGIKSGLYDYGIVPAENTFGGVVDQVNQLLIRTELNVVGALTMPVHHCLLVLPGTDTRDIHTVYSRAQTLVQCRRFLIHKGLQSVACADTERPARILAEKRQSGSAAIDCKLAAKFSHLDIVEENIEDIKGNKIRYLVLGKEGIKEDGEKCSIIVSLEHKEDALHRVLGIFKSNKINLTRVESISTEPGNNTFFLDFIGSERDEKALRTLNELKRISMNFRFLGCYQEKKGI